MAKISVLSPHVADLIAAGEVVERPGSVVKELMENSIDAGASALTVEIRSGGMSLIRVTDNGCGMAPADAETAFLRHATSKLRDERGLEAIGTLGFRGEALAAIAAVSRIELLTSEAGKVGTRLCLEAGVITEKDSAGCPQGTTFIVRNLFFNTPARLKFMKNDKAEGANVTTAVIRCALSHPEVSVRYIKDGKEECHTPGDGNTDSCIYSLFGRDFASGMLKAAGDDEAVSVSGYISSPAGLRGNRTAQYFFVNGRFIKSKTLQAALEQAYKNSMFTGRFPACVLYINLSPAGVDVNVHPTKTEVKFLREKQVFDCVYYACLSALTAETEKAAIRLSPGTKAVLAPEPDSKPKPEPQKAKAVPSGDFFKAMPADKYRSAYTGFKTSVPPLSRERRSAVVRSSPGEPYQTAIPLPVPDAVPREPRPTQAAGVPYRIIGEALSTYIIVEQGESLFLIDKHAAHERIIFDRLKAEGARVCSQLLLSPIAWEPGPEDAQLLLDNADTLEKFGFEVDDFGGGSIIIRQIPSDLDSGDAKSALEELCEAFRGSGADPCSMRDKLLHTIACKAAIKAGKSTDLRELSELTAQVMSGQVKYCPHGRPVAMELSKANLDKNFKRI